MTFWTELATTLFLLIGGLFVLLGSIGLARLPDFFMRLHTPTKATTLGLAGLLLASMILFSVQTGQLSLRELLITIFLLITAPVSAHMLAKTALHHKVRLYERTQGQEYVTQARQQKPPVTEEKTDKD